MRRAAVAAGLLTALAALAPPQSRAADAPAGPKDIDLVLCLDVSNSMDGLIDSAKIRLWDVVNELARVKPTPNLRVGLYSYGNPAYPREAGWVRKELDLTTDLDEVYAKLNALRTSGGDEYVARVSRAALTEQKWSAAPTALRLVFVCGNEPADQDKEVTLAAAAKLAREAGVVVNTIYCGPAGDRIAGGWAEFAAACGGKYANIDQEKARRPVVATPFDKEILELNGRLNSTYVALKTEAAARGVENQAAQDRAATAAGAGAALGRAESKANALYRNSTWDLVDRMKDDPKFDLSKIKDEELPDELKKLKPEERLAYLKKKAGERAELQKKINDLSAKRQKHVDEELKKQPKSPGEQALDEAVKGIIREQAAGKGFAVPANNK